VSSNALCIKARTCSRNASHALVEAPLGAPQYCHRRRPAAAVGQAVQVRLEAVLSGIATGLTCRRSTATRQCLPSPKKVPGRDSACRAGTANARDAGCSPRSHPRAASLPSRRASAKSPTLNQHPYRSAAFAEARCPGLPLETFAPRGTRLSRSGALRPRAPRPTRALWPVCDGLRASSERRSAERGRHLQSRMRRFRATAAR